MVQPGFRLPHPSTCRLVGDRGGLTKRILQLLLLLLLYCSGFADGSWWRIADLSLDPAHFHRDNRSYELCGDTAFFTEHQRDTCYSNPELLKVIVHAANTAKYECQSYFQNNRWNCSAKRGSGIYYGNFDDKGNRETAYLSAINSASLAWTITRFCTKGELTTCQCDRIPRNKHSTKWTWGGCSEDIKYGIKQARSFTDPQENRTTSFGLMNLHNNEAARRILRSRMEKVCKCHGMSGSCTTRVCWRRLPPMKLIADTLGSLFDAAAQVKPVENKGIIRKLMRKDLEYKKVNKSDLVYIAESPNYCEENESLGIFSTRGRFCNRTSYGIEGCRLLCCGRGYQTRIRNVEEKCNCKFVWCCSVKCDTCSMRKDEHICN